MNKKETIDFGEFYEAFYNEPYIKPDRDFEYKMKLLSSYENANEAFKVFDVNKNDEIDADEFKDILYVLAKKKSEMNKGIIKPLPFNHK